MCVLARSDHPAMALISAHGTPAATMAVAPPGRRLDAAKLDRLGRPASAAKMRTNFPMVVLFWSPHGLAVKTGREVVSERDQSRAWQNGWLPSLRRTNCLGGWTRLGFSRTRKEMDSGPTEKSASWREQMDAPLSMKKNPKAIPTAARRRVVSSSGSTAVRRHNSATQGGRGSLRFGTCGAREAAMTWKPRSACCAQCSSDGGGGKRRSRCARFTAAMWI